MKKVLKPCGQVSNDDLLLQIFSCCLTSQVSPGVAQQLFELRHNKTGLRGFRLGLTQTRLCSLTGWLEA